MGRRSQWDYGKHLAGDRRWHADWAAAHSDQTERVQALQDLLDSWLRLIDLHPRCMDQPVAVD